MTPFWHQFALKICETLGIDPVKQPVAAIDFKIVPGKPPTVNVLIEPFGNGELRPVLEVFQSANWHNAREVIETIEPHVGQIDVVNDYVPHMDDAERQKLYEILHRQYKCRMPL